jgi:hypothetical protein
VTKREYADKIKAIWFQTRIARQEVDAIRGRVDSQVARASKLIDDCDKRLVALLAVDLNRLED